MNITSDLHSQRPEYQRENIELSWKMVREHSALYNPHIPDFDLNNISYVDFGGKHGGMYIPKEGRIELDIRHCLGIKITVHELLHVASGKGEYLIGIQDKSGKTRKFQGLNEGITEIIGLEIFLRNFETIKRFREKYKVIIDGKIIEAAQTGDNLSHFIYTRGCPHTGWYHKGKNDRIYETLMHLNYIILDYIAFLSSKNSLENFEEVRKKLWEEICFCYFNSDSQGFSQLIAPIQRRTSQSLSEIGFGEIDQTKKLIEGIKLDISDTFRIPYVLESFSEDLEQFDTIFHSTF